MAVSRGSHFVACWLDSGTDDDPHTQEILAERLSPVLGRVLTQSTISNVKSGKSTPRIDLVEAFRVVLGIEPSWWIPDASVPAENSSSTTDDDAA